MRGRLLSPGPVASHRAADCEDPQGRERRLKLCDVYIGRLKWSDGGLVENVDFRIGELQPGAPWMQRAVTENLEQQKATQPEQHAAAQGGDPDQRAEGVGDGYTWKDDDEELEILLDVPESTKRKDVKIEFRRQEVRVSKPNTLTLKLFKNVEVDGCSWTIGKPGQLVLTLLKADAAPWPQLLKELEGLYL